MFNFNQDSSATNTTSTAAASAITTTQLLKNHEEDKTYIMVRMSESLSYELNHSVPKIKFHGQRGGAIKFQNGKTYDFTLEQSDNSVECIRQSGKNNKWESVGRMACCLHVKGKDDVYQRTRTKMEAAEQEKRKYCTKLLGSPDRNHEKSLHHNNHHNHNNSHHHNNHTNNNTSSHHKHHSQHNHHSNKSNHSQQQQHNNHHNNHNQQQQPPSSNHQKNCQINNHSNSHHQNNHNLSSSATTATTTTTTTASTTTNSGHKNNNTTTTTNARHSNNAPNNIINNNSKSVSRNNNANNDDDSVIVGIIAKYPPITNDKELKKYKAEFDKDYKEYSHLHGYLHSIQDKFKKLRERMDKHVENSPQWDSIKEQIFNEYERVQGDSNFHKGRNKYKQLHAKLAHIKDEIFQYKRQKRVRLHSQKNNINHASNSKTTKTKTTSTTTTNNNNIVVNNNKRLKR